MDDQHEPNQDYNAARNNYLSSFQRNVVLRDWWLIKCSNEFEGKRFGVAGIEDSSDNRRRGALRVFTSSPIIKAFDVFTLQSSDGLHITLQGFLNKERLVKCGFDPQISCKFVFGFPPCWEKFCRNWFKGDESVETDKVCNSVLSPCESKKDNFEGSLAESVDRSTVTEKNVAEDNDKDGCSGGFRAGDGKTVRRKPLRLQSRFGGISVEGERQVGCSGGFRAGDGKTVKRKPLRLQSRSGGISVEGERKVERSKVQETTIGGDHGNEGLNGAMSGDVEKDECQAIANEKKLDENQVQNRTNDGAHGNECLDKAKSVDVEKDEGEANNDEVISPVDGCGKRHSGSDNVEKVTSKNPIRKSLTSEQRNGKLKTHSVAKDSDDKSKPGKSGRPKKSEKTRKSHRKVTEPMNHTRSKGKEADETLSWEKTIRKIDFDAEVSPEKKTKKQKTVFDFEVTPEKEAKKLETNADSTGSVGQRRSRSGRVLVSSLEFWRNQVPVYDKDRNIVQVREGHESPSEGKESASRKAKKMRLMIGKESASRKAKKMRSNK